MAAVDTAIAGGRLTTTDGRTAWLVERADAPAGMAGTLRQARGACIFHRPRRGRADGRPGPFECAVHATLGPEALPATCQHFPRVCLIDDGGVRVSLSHVCPTALDLLLQHQGPLTIVAGPPAVPGRAVPEGLDVRGDWPPRLTARVLMDAEGFAAWEAHVVDQLAGRGAVPGTVASVLTRLDGHAAALTRWTPGGRSLADAVRALASPGPAEAVEEDDRAFARARQTLAVVAASCRPPWTWPALPGAVDEADARWVAPHWPPLAPLVRRYLATRAFGAWAAYHHDGASGLVAWLRLVAAVVRAEAARAAAEAGRPLDAGLTAAAIRQSDLLLLHHADASALDHTPS